MTNLTRPQPTKSQDARSNERSAGLGFAVKIGVDIVAAIVVGVVIGLLLNGGLTQNTWLLIVFFILGAAAGMLNVFRAVSGYGYAAGYQQKGPKRAPKNSGEPFRSWQNHLGQGIAR